MNNEEYTSEIEVLLYLAIELLDVFDKEEAMSFRERHLGIIRKHNGK